MGSERIRSITIDRTNDGAYLQLWREGGYVSWTECRRVNSKDEWGEMIADIIFAVLDMRASTRVTEVAFPPYPNW